MMIKVLHIQQLKFGIKILLVTIFVTFASQHKIQASEYVDLYGKWKACIYVSLPDSCILNDSTCNAYGIIPVMGSEIYFIENAKGVLDNPARPAPIEFKWHLSNDTIHIFDGDTLVLYKIDQKKSNKLYLRLLSKGTKSFHFSYVVVCQNFNEFILDNSIKIKELDNGIRETINKIKERRRVDEVIVGYQKTDNTYHYTYLCDNKRDYVSGVFDDIDNWKKKRKYILFILYDENMCTLQRITNYLFQDNEFLPKRVAFDTREDFPINRDVK